MTFSGLTSGTLPHHNKYASRQGRGITRVIVHHWAGTVGGDTSLASPGRDASTNYILYGDGRLVGQVPEEYRAWTSGSWEADSYSITVEVQNSTNGPEWRVSDTAIKALTALIADIALRYGWGTVTRARVRGHQEFAATACPGPYLYPLLNNIAVNANELLNPSVKPLPLPTRKKDKDMFLCYFKHAGGVNQERWAFFGANFWFELSTKAAVERFKAQNGIPKDVHSFDCGNESNWERFQRVTGLPADKIIHV